MNSASSHLLLGSPSIVFPSGVVYPPGVLVLECIVGASVLLPAIPCHFSVPAEDPSASIFPLPAGDSVRRNDDGETGRCCSRVREKFNEAVEKWKSLEKKYDAVVDCIADGGIEGKGGGGGGGMEQKMKRKRWKGRRGGNWKKNWKEFRGSRHAWKCDVCDVIMNGIQQVLDHMAGKNHSRKVKNRQEISESTPEGVFSLQGKTPPSEETQDDSEKWSLVNSQAPIRIRCFPMGPDNPRTASKEVT